MKKLGIIAIVVLVASMMIGTEFGYADDVDPKAFKQRKDMEKVKLGPQRLLPSVVTIVGATTAEGKPNFQAASWVNFVNFEPPYIYVGLGKQNYTPEGILHSKTFSVNVPSSDMMYVVDYIGTRSGRDVDKTKLFELFYGETKTAPMIKECPLNIEAEVVQVVDLPSNHLIIGKVVEVYVGKEYQIDEKTLNIKKIDPLIFGFYDMQYRTIGDGIGTAWQEGDKYQPE